MRHSVGGDPSLLFRLVQTCSDRFSIWIVCTGNKFEKKPMVCVRVDWNKKLWNPPLCTRRLHAVQRSSGGAPSLLFRLVQRSRPQPLAASVRGCWEAVARHYGRFWSVLSKKYIRKISILDTKIIQNNKNKCTFDISILKVGITLVILFFLLFYLLLVRIEICLKYTFWTIIFKKVSWTKLLSLSFLLWCLVLRLQPCMFIRRQEAFAET